MKKHFNKFSSSLITYSFLIFSIIFGNDLIKLFKAEPFIAFALLLYESLMHHIQNGSILHPPCFNLLFLIFALIIQSQWSLLLWYHKVRKFFWVRLLCDRWRMFIWSSRSVRVRFYLSRWWGWVFYGFGWGFEKMNGLVDGMYEDIKVGKE